LKDKKLRNMITVYTYCNAPLIEKSGMPVTSLKLNFAPSTMTFSKTWNRKTLESYKAGQAVMAVNMFRETTHGQVQPSRV